MSDEQKEREGAKNGKDVGIMKEREIESADKFMH